MRIFAQVLLVVLITTVLAIFISLSSPSAAEKLVVSVAGAFPFFEIWVDLLSTFHSFELSNVTEIYIDVFFEAIIMGICMVVCKKIADFLHATRILPFGNVLVTFLGVLLGCFICSPLADTEGISSIAVGLIAIYGLLLMISSILPIHKTLSKIITLADILLIIISSLVSVILTGYIAALFLFAGREISLSVLLSIATLTIISLLILYTVDGIKAKDKD